MTDSNVIRINFHPAAPIRAIPDDSLRADCERLMRKLVRTNAPRRELHILADVLDGIIERIEK